MLIGPCEFPMNGRGGGMSGVAHSVVPFGKKDRPTFPNETQPPASRDAERGTGYDEQRATSDVKPP